MEKGATFPKPTEDDVAWFDELLPDRPDVRRKPMFGQMAGFANDSMFLCLFGDRIAVRLDEKSREELLRIPETGPFAPMGERVMKEYVVLPPSWRDTPEAAREWVERSADYAATLPAKAKKPAKR
jgi:TfoX/Sxy family transcriptional regulator of competence genes